MKKLKLLLLCGLMLILLTGCIYDLDVTVNKDGSAELEFINLYLPEEIESMAVEPGTYANKEVRVLEDGFTLTGITQDNMEGQKATKHFDSVEDINFEAFLFGEDSKYSISNESAIIIEEKFMFKKYILNMDIDFSEFNQQLLQHEYDVNYKMSFRFPGIITESNATEKINGKLTWVLSIDNINELRSETLEIKPIGIILICIIICLVLAITTITVSILSKKKKIKTEEAKVKAERLKSKAEELLEDNVIKEDEKNEDLHEDNKEKNIDDGKKKNIKKDSVEENTIIASKEDKKVNNNKKDK